MGKDVQLTTHKPISMIFLTRISSQRQNENLLSCFSTLFGVKEFEIQEDFLQISELVHIENAFINRPPSINFTNQSLSNTYLNIPNVTEKEVLYHERFFTEYFGSPALLSERISASRESVLSIYYFLIEGGKEAIRIGNFAGELDFWILGASYNDTVRFDANDDVKCGAHSCYEQSLKSGKICKPGLYSSLILFKLQ